VQRGRETAREQRAVAARRPFHRHVVHARHSEGDRARRGHVHVHGGQRAGPDARGRARAGRAVPAAGVRGRGAGRGQAARGRGGRQRRDQVQRDREPGAGVGGVDTRGPAGFPAVRRRAARAEGHRGLGRRVHVQGRQHTVPVVVVPATGQPDRERVADPAGPAPSRRSQDHAGPAGGHRGHRRHVDVFRVATRLAHTPVQVVARVQLREPVDQRHDTGHWPEVHHPVRAPGQ